MKKLFYIFEQKGTYVRNYFGIVGVVVEQIVTFNIEFGFCVFNSIWEHTLKICSTPKIEFFRPPQNRTFSPYVAEASLNPSAPAAPILEDVA